MAAAEAYFGSPQSVAAIAERHDRLTLTVEEAARILGISRALAYEAVRRHEIPHITIGRRILVPTSALARMLQAADGAMHDTDRRDVQPASQARNTLTTLDSPAVERDHGSAHSRPNFRR